MRFRLSLLLIVVLVAVAAFAPSASASVSVTNPGNANNVTRCKILEDIFSAFDPAGIGYPYTLSIFTPSGTVGPLTISNRGGCVSAFAQNKDWTVAIGNFPA